jgi:hypothetical protein
MGRFFIAKSIIENSLAHVQLLISTTTRVTMFCFSYSHCLHLQLHHKQNNLLNYYNILI